MIFLVRDPKDVIVSSYFEMSRRGHLFGENPYESRQPVYQGSLPEFIHRSTGGFDTILAYYNTWAENRHIPEGFLLVRYEDTKGNPHHELRRIMNFLDLGVVSDRTIADAVEFASFDNMRQMEREGLFQSYILKPANSADDETYKTRKGKVKGYIDYLDENEIASLDKKIQEDLSEIFGYNA